MADNIHEGGHLRECKTSLFVDGKHYKPGLDVQETSLLEGNKTELGLGQVLVKQISLIMARMRLRIVT